MALITPAKTPATLDLIRTPLVRRLLDRIAEAQSRTALRRGLGGLSARYLRDVGLTEHDVMSIRPLPLSCDAQAHLARRVRMRSTNW